MIRSISEAEVEVIERALLVGTGEAPPPEQLRSLNVTAVCQCGCATVWFGPDGDATIGHKLVDVVAAIQEQPVDVIVWSDDEKKIVGLEIVGYGKLDLPTPCSIKKACDE